MNKKRAVLIVTSHFPPNFGGVESHLDALVSAIVKKNWQVIISTYQPLASSKRAPFLEKNKNITVYRLPYIGFNIVHKLTNYPLFEFLYLFPGLFLLTVFVLIKYKKDIRVIHCQGLVPSCIGVFARKIINKRLITSVHNLYFFPKRGLYPAFARYIFSKNDLILAPTEYSVKEILRLGVLRNKVRRFRYWVDLKVFSPKVKQIFRQKLRWDKMTVFFAGRLIETKGIKILIEAFHAINGKINLVIAGDGVLKSYVESKTKIFKNIRYLGRIENQDLPKYYSASDLVVVPSLVDEGFGFVVMEAVACGAPVIASDKGGLSEAVNKKIGLLIKPTSKNFKKAIENLNKNRVKLNELQRNTRSYAVKHFGRKNALEIISYYEG